MSRFSSSISSWIKGRPVLSASILGLLLASLAYLFWRLWRNKRKLNTTTVAESLDADSDRVCYEKEGSMCLRVQNSACLPPLIRSEYLAVPSDEVAQRLRRLLGDLHHRSIIRGSNLGSTITFRRHRALSLDERRELVRLAVQCATPVQQERLQVAIGWNEEMQMGIFHAVVASSQLEQATHFISPFTAELWVPKKWTTPGSNRIEDFCVVQATSNAAVTTKKQSKN